MTPTTSERRRDYIDLHERVATLEVLSNEIRADVRDIHTDVKDLRRFLEKDALPPLVARLTSLEGSRRIVHAVWAVLSTIGIILAWAWDHLTHRAAP